MSTITVTVAGSIVPIKEQSLKLPDKIEQRKECSFVVQDDSSAFSFKKGQLVTVTDSVLGLQFAGKVRKIKRSLQTGTSSSPVLHDITCDSKAVVFDEKTSNKLYTNQYAGAIFVDQIKDRWVDGITANYAVDTDDTQSDFATGTLSGTIATSNVEDGNLELAPSGTIVTVTESTTSVFGSGSLTNMSASNNTLGPSATSALKMVATQSVSGITNSYTYVKIWGGSIAIISGRYLSYDVWISSSSPEAKLGVDMNFTDNTSYRDNAVNFDSQNKSPHPGTDLAGLATDQWYHRKFLLDNLTSKTIASITLSCEGDKTGTYTAYFKNILEVDVNDNVINTFFSGSLNVNPAQQISRQGYSSTKVSIVSTYDCSTAQRVSPSYNIDPAKILKSSYLTYKTSLPTGYTFNLSYSIDGGNSYTPCTVNSALPNLPAGLSLVSKSIKFLATFTQGTGSDPSQKPTLTSMQLTVNPSYTASKNDVKVSATTNAEWASGATLTNTQVTSAVLLLFGGVRNFDDASIAGQTLFGGRGTGPNTATTCKQYVDSKQFRMFVFQNTEARSRLDFLGQWQNFIFEFDVYVDNSLMKVGCVYRTSNWSNWDADYAYCLQIFGTTINLSKGSNSTASSDGTQTILGTATVTLSQQTVHHVKLIVNGTSHQVYFDDVLTLTVTDGTYAGSGYVGFRITNTDTVNGYVGLFDNLGLTVTGLSGTWLSPSTSLTSASTYGGSVVSWQDVSTDPTTSTALVESTINGGSTYQTVTNGGTIPNLTPGQSLSGINVQFRITLTTSTASAMPQVQSFVAYILGGFSSSGTRINKALLLTSAGTCGTTLVFWNAITPTNTTIAVATSLDGITYTSVANGGSIAGLTQQPTPTIDSFNLLSNSNYINTFRSGGGVASWVWDTINDRLTATGGTNGLLIYNGIASSANVSVMADLDRSDGGGLVLHYKNSGNSLYYCVINDNLASSNANTIAIYKYDFSGPFLLTSVGISFTRGVFMRFTFQYLNGVLSASVDGTQVASSDDSTHTPITTGQSGLYNNSGISQFYNLRIQPFGDNLSGKQVYVKETLTSTDPTATPQITDLTTLVTNPNIQAGALIPTADYTNTYLSDNINDLSKKSDYIWDVKPDGSALFMQRQTTPSPWVLTGNDTLISGLTVEDVADLYRGRHTLIGVKDQLNVSETFTGDGVKTSWSLKYSVVSVSSMTLNGQSITFGQKSIDTGKSIYYEVGSNSLAADTSLTVLLSTDVVVISYTGQYETTVTRDNTGQFAGTISQKDYIAQSGISVPPLTLLNQVSAANTVSGFSDDLDTSLCRAIALDINVTAMSGTTPTLQFFVERKDAGGNYYIIYSSNLINLSPITVSRTIGRLGQTKEALGSTCRVRWTITGTTPSFTFNVSVQGQIDANLAGIGIVEAIEDVSDQNLTVAAAQSLGDSRLQKYGVIGRTIRFGTRRTGLAAGQYLNCFVSQLGLINAALLITSVDKTQKMLSSGNQDYWHSVEATESSNLTSWQKAMNNASIK